MSLVEVARVPTQGLEIRPSRHLAPERAKICAEERKKNKFRKKILFVASSVVTMGLRFLFLFFGKHCNRPHPPRSACTFFLFTGWGSCALASSPRSSVENFEGSTVSFIFRALSGGQQTRDKTLTALYMFLYIYENCSKGWKTKLLVLYCEYTLLLLYLWLVRSANKS